MKVLTNVCPWLGVVLCFLAVGWNNVTFFADANADCYVAGTFRCEPGDDAESCPEQRCINTALPGANEAVWRCATEIDHSATHSTTKYHKEVKYLSHPASQPVVSGARGKSGLNAAEDKPCKTTGLCGCTAKAERNDSEQAPYCSAPKNPSDGPLEVKIQTVDASSVVCFGEE